MSDPVESPRNNHDPREAVLALARDGTPGVLRVRPSRGQLYLVLETPTKSVGGRLTTKQWRFLVHEVERLLEPER